MVNETIAGLTRGQVSTDRELRRQRAEQSADGRPTWNHVEESLAELASRWHDTLEPWRTPQPGGEGVAADTRPLPAELFRPWRPPQPGEASPGDIDACRPEDLTTLSLAAYQCFQAGHRASNEMRSRLASLYTQLTYIEPLDATLRGSLALRREDMRGEAGELAERLRRDLSTRLSDLEADRSVADVVSAGLEELSALRADVEAGAPRYLRQPEYLRDDLNGLSRKIHEFQAHQVHEEIASRLAADRRIDHLTEAWDTESADLHQFHTQQTMSLGRQQTDIDALQGLIETSQATAAELLAARTALGEDVASLHASGERYRHLVEGCREDIDTATRRLSNLTPLTAQVSAAATAYTEESAAFRGRLQHIGLPPQLGGAFAELNRAQHALTRRLAALEEELIHGVPAVPVQRAPNHADVPPDGHVGQPPPMLDPPHFPTDRPLSSNEGDDFERVARADLQEEEAAA